MRRKKHKNINKLLLRIIIVSIFFMLCGIFYISILSKSNKLLIKENLATYFTSLNKLNYFNAFIRCFSSNLLFIILIWIFGISIIGVIFIIFFFIIKSFILGFSISSIIYFYHVKGILLALIYCIPLIIDLLIIIILSYFGIQFSKNLNRLVFFKKEVNFKHMMRRYLKILLFSIIVIFISSIIEIYLVPNILKWLV